MTYPTATSDSYSSTMNNKPFEVKVYVSSNGESETCTAYVLLDLSPPGGGGCLEAETNALPPPDCSREQLEGEAAARAVELEAAEVEVSVYDALGRRVATLADGTEQAGWHAAPFEAAGLPAGVYLVRMRAGSFATTQRLVLVR